MSYFNTPGVRPGDRARPIAKRKLPVSVEEYAGRVRRVREHMARQGIDAFIVTDASNICYLCGYEASSAYVAQGLVIYANEDQPRFYLRRQDAPAAMYMTYIDNDRIHGYPENYVGDAYFTGFDVILKSINDHGAVKQIAIEYDATSASDVAIITSRFNQFSYHDLSGVIEKMRLIKSTAECVHMRAAGRITQAVMLQLSEWFREGRRECDVAADITAALIRGLPDLPGEYTEEILMPGGMQTGTSHITWTDNKVKAGQHYNIEFAAGRYRYQVPLLRSLSVGKPTQKLSRLYGYMVEGCEAALAKVRPGATCADVSKAYCAVMDKAGYWKDSRCGYPIGINWLETSCSLRVDDPTVLEEGMAFHLMLGTWLEDDFGAGISESLIVTSGGYDLLAEVPRELITVEGGA